MAYEFFSLMAVSVVLAAAPVHVLTELGLSGLGYGVVSGSPVSLIVA